MSLAIPRGVARSRPAFLFSAAFLTVAVPAWAEEYTFIGGAWDSAASWQVNGQPASEPPDGDDTIVSPTATAGNLFTGDDRIIGAIDMQGTTTLMMLGDGSDTVTVRQTLRFTGGSFTIRGSSARPSLIVENEASAATAVLVDVATTLGTSSSTNRPLVNFTINSGVMELNANVSLAAETAALRGGVHFNESTAATFTFNTTDYQTRVAFLSGGIATSKVINSTSVPAGTPTGTIARLIIDGNDSFGTKAYAGLIQDGSSSRYASVEKSGSITQILTGVSTYTGGTTISGGTLLANSATGTATASSTGAGAVLVRNGGTLGGTGHVSGAVTVEAGGALRGGDGNTGTALTLSNSADLTLSAQSVIKLTLGDDGAHSSLARTGGAWTFDTDQAFLFDTQGEVAEGAFFQGLITGLDGDPGTLETWTVLNPNWEGEFSFDGGEINLTVTAVPEPAMIAPSLAGIGLMLRRRRRAM